jgi:hypothetical protein
MSSRFICATRLPARQRRSAGQLPHLSTPMRARAKTKEQRLRRDLRARHNADPDCVRRPYPQLGDSQAALESDLQSLFETTHQVICSERLSEQANCAAGGRSRFQPRLSTRGNHDHRNSPITSHEQSHEIKPAHAGHVNVGDDTVTRGSRARREKLFGACKLGRAVSLRTERLDKRHSEWLVIVYDRD